MCVSVCLSVVICVSKSLNFSFKMAENVDSELKRMAQDLKEIIDQMNSANSNQDEESTVRM